MATRRELRLKRHRRVRKRVVGTTGRPRLNVFRSSKHVYAQLIDDERGHTLVAASTMEPEVRAAGASGATVLAARLVGQRIGERAVALGIQQAVFDRGGYVYHGRIAALADGARGAGLQF